MLEIPCVKVFNYLKVLIKRLKVAGYRIFYPISATFIRK